jgi:hypothetical protein
MAPAAAIYSGAHDGTPGGVQSLPNIASDLWRQLIGGRLKLLTDDRIKPCSAGLRQFWPPTWWVTAD